MLLETIRENVLYNRLITAENSLSNIINGLPLSLSDIKNIQREIDEEVNDYFMKERTILIVQTFGGAPDHGDTKIYHMDDLTGEINLLRICKIDEDLDMIRREYMTKRYVTRLFTRNDCDYTGDALLAYDYGNDCYLEITGNKARTFPNTMDWLEAEW